MKHNVSSFTVIILTAVVMLLTLLACPAPVRAEDAKKEAAVSTWDGDIVVRTTGNQRDSFKYLEYRTMPAAGVDSLNYTYESGEKDRGFNLRMTNLLRDDGNYALDFNSYGKWKLELGYDSLLHRFGYDVRTLYQGTGTGTLSIDPAAKAPFLVAATRTNANYVNNSFLVDPLLVRRKFDIGLDLFEDKPVNLRLDFSSEDRSGFRPFGLAWQPQGLQADALEPIAYTTSTFTAALDFARSKSFYGSVAYSSNSFDNRVDSLSVENPIISAPIANMSNVIRLDLYPNNKANTLSLDLAFRNLFWGGRLTAHGAWADLTQSSNLLPYTTNTLAAGATLINGTPGYLYNNGGFDSRVATNNLTFNWTARPRKNVSLNAKYYHYGWTNTTSERVFYDFRVDGNAAQARQYRTEPANWASDIFEFNVGLDMASNSRFNVGYVTKNYSRTRLQSTAQSENGVKLSFDTHPSDWFSFRANYGALARRGNYDVTAPYQWEMQTYGVPYSGATGVSPYSLRKFDQANRDQSIFGAEASFTASKYLNFSLSYNSIDNRYPDSGYGRTRDSYTLFGVDAELHASDRFRLNAFYNAEEYKLDQKGHVSGNAGTGGRAVLDWGDPRYSLYDWATNNSDTTNTVGASLWANLSPRKLDMSVDYQNSQTVGKTSFPGGARTSAGVAWTPADFGNNDNTNLSTLNLAFKMYLKKENTFTLGMLWEKYVSDDWQNNGFLYVPYQTTGAFNNLMLNGGHLTPSYDASTVYVKYSFKL